MSLARVHWMKKSHLLRPHFHPLHTIATRLNPQSGPRTRIPRISVLSTASAMASPSYSGPARAPWRDLLVSHLGQSSSQELSIATVHQGGTLHPGPRVRTCGVRGFFPELELHPSGAEDMKQQVEDGGNPPVFESDMLTFTTDVRMEKLGQLESARDEIEALFWFKEVMTQWRVKGRAFAIGDPRGQEEVEEKLARSAIKKGLRVKSDSDEIGKWTWEKAVTKYFANHSPIVRGSFRNPPPGQPRSKAPSDPDLRLGQKVTDLHDPVARGNFRVVVIRPREVERLDLSNSEDIRRWNWTFTGDYEQNDQSVNQWKETELWP